MVMPTGNKIFTTALIAIIAVGLAAWASGWFRGFLQTGGKTLPTPNTQG